MGHCYNTTVVNASVEEVWAKIRNFHDMSWASGVIDSVEDEGAKPGSHPGAKRLLNGVFHETLLVLDDKDHILSYRIDDGPGPLAQDAVTKYIGRVHLLPVTDEDTTFVEWESDFECKDEQAVEEFCNPIYQALLSSLRDNLSA